MSEFNYAVRELLTRVWFFYLPVLIIVGTIANCLCIIVTFRTGLKEMVSRYYFIGMTIANEGMLLTLGYTWLQSMMHSFYMMLDIYYVLAVYVPSFLQFLSHYFILAFIVERFKATRLPPRHDELKTTKIITLIITILGLLPAAYWVFLDDAIDHRETTNKKIWHIVSKFIRTIITDLGPFIAITVLSTQIFTTIRRKPVMGHIVTNTTNGTHEVSRQQSSNTMSVQEMKINKMLVIVAVVFVGLNIVSTILELLFSLYQDIDSDQTIWTMWHASNLFSVTSLGITFFVCCAVDQDFRRTALTAILCRRYPHSETSQSVLYTRVNNELNAPVLTSSSGNSPGP